MKTPSIKAAWANKRNERRLNEYQKYTLISDAVTFKTISTFACVFYTISYNECVSDRTHQRGGWVERVEGGWEQSLLRLIFTQNVSETLQSKGRGSHRNGMWRRCLSYSFPSLFSPFHHALRFLLWQIHHQPLTNDDSHSSHTFSHTQTCTRPSPFIQTLTLRSELQEDISCTDLPAPPYRHIPSCSSPE